MVLNTGSTVHKAALLHQTKHEHRLDLLALQETWIKSDAPEAIKLDVAPKDSLPLINRGNYDDRRGEGIALIHKNLIKCIKIKTNTTPTIEYLIIQLIDTTKPFHIIIAYRPPSCSMSAFIEDFDKLIDNESKEVNNILIHGDFNASGSQDPSDPSIDAKLQKQLEKDSLTQHISTSTHKKPYL